MDSAEIVRETTFVVGSLEHELADLLDELPARVDRDAEHLRDLAHQDAERQSAHEADEDRLGEEVGEEAELEEREQQEHHAREDRLGESEGGVALRAGDGEAADGRRHERRGRGIRRQHELARRDDQGVDDRRHDQRVEPRRGRKPGDLRVADVQRNGDREQGDAGHGFAGEVLPCESGEGLLHQGSGRRGRRRSRYPEPIAQREGLSAK